MPLTRAATRRVRLSQQNQAASPLLRLPAELRNNIYNHVFEHAKGAKDLQPLLACKQVHDEASLLAFSCATFSGLQSDRRLRPEKVKALSAAHADAIPRLEIKVPTLYWDPDFVGRLVNNGINPKHVTVIRDYPDNPDIDYVQSEADFILWALLVFRQKDDAKLESLNVLYPRIEYDCLRRFCMAFEPFNKQERDEYGDMASAIAEAKSFTHVFTVTEKRAYSYAYIDWGNDVYASFSVTRSIPIHIGGHDEWT